MWFDEEVSLAEFSGQTVRIIFATNPGPALDSEYDWAVWSRPVILEGSG
jgi:hypothetical protein